MAELVDAPALGAGVLGRAGSNPAPRTTSLDIGILASSALWNLTPRDMACDIASFFVTRRSS